VILAKQTRMNEALAKSDGALTHAPNWKQLQGARDAAARLKM
jgi:hypothetical protein